jgi:lon-related putative ATP-dependent protease
VARLYAVRQGANAGGEVHRQDAKPPTDAAAMPKRETLPPERLRARCDSAALDFQTTDDLEDLPGMLGQPRVDESLGFGLAIRQPGFNLFVLGPRQADVQEVVLRFLQSRAAEQPVPSDWLYVHDFDQPRRPRALRVPAGRGAKLAVDVRELVAELGVAIPAALESEEYRARSHVIESEIGERQNTALAGIEAEARQRGLAFIRTPMGMGFAPLRDDAVLGPDEFAKLPPAERERIASDVGAMQERLQAVAADFPSWQREGAKRLRDLTREFGMHAARNLVDELRTRYAELPEVLEHLSRIEADVVEHVELFRRGEPAAPSPLPFAVAPDADMLHLERYRVNVLVDHGSSRGAPVVYEPHPSYQNLVGAVEHRPALGTLVTDFTLIKPGALHRANGGYLVLDARRVLAQPWAWEGLKQALRSGRVRIESLGQVFSIVSTVSLEPEEIPLEVKVVLLDEPFVYHLLHSYDPDFGDLFKVAVDFDDRIPRTLETTALYARFVATQARAAKLRPLERDAVALVIEESARRTGDSERLSALTRDVLDLLAESNHRAEVAGRAVTTADDVRAAVAASERRLDRVRDRLLEETERGTLLVDSEGSRVGQINGLAVFQLGSFAFGRPSRITARVRVGAGQVIDIEREVQLGGPLHSKGVLILSSFLAARYASDVPLSLTASLVFEQSYGGIDGDSASAAELFALLSALAEAPLRQDLAVTGSVNQLGEVQAIGGVNEKIEGFFDLCKARGLTGTQGVLIPSANVKHLMLREDVVVAVASGRFAVHPVATIDEGIELLTGLEAGAADTEGRYPEGTVNRRVYDRLVGFAEKRRSFAAPDQKQAPASAPVVSGAAEEGS